MTLDELERTYGLTEEVLEFCQANGLHDLSAIQRQAYTEQSFSDLPRCSAAIEHRLLCLVTAVDIQLNLSGSTSRSWAYSENHPTPIALDSHVQLHSDHEQIPAGPLRDLSFDPDLNEIKKYFGLSVRAYNVCDNADLKRLSLIRAFSKTRLGFRGLRNCGISTCLEIDLLLELTAQGGAVLANGLSIEQEEVAAALDLPFDPGLEQLQAQFGMSVRAFNVCQNNDLHKLSDLIIYRSRKQDFRHLRNCGVKTMAELVELVERASTHIHAEVIPSKEELELQAWSVRHSIEKDDLAYLFSSEGKMTLLRFLERYFDSRSNRTKDKLELALLKSHEIRPTFAELGAQFDISVERARQIVLGLDRSLETHLALVADLPKVQDNYPEFLSIDPVFRVGEDVAFHLNDREGTGWSQLFLVHLASAINRHHLKRISWAQLFGNDPRMRYLDHSFPFIVDADLFEHLQLATKGFSARYAQKRKTATDHQLLAQLSNVDPILAERLTAALHKLILRGFPDVQMEGAYALLPPNAFRTQEELLAEVLTNLGEPSHVERIQETWLKLFPNDPISVMGIRSAAVRNGKRFISIGRTSTYGLRKWEDERDDLKGGTIRDIIWELLEESSVPLHMEQLLNEVHKYRPETHLTSVRHNLQLDHSGRFRFFPGDYLGLNARTYECIPPPQERVPGSLMRSKVISRFVGAHSDELVKFLMSRSNASNSRVDQVVKKAIEEKRIITDEQGIILSVIPRTSTKDDDTLSDS